VLAEEAVQDAFYQLTRPECNFVAAEQGAFRLWFTRVTANSAKMVLRREKRAAKYAAGDASSKKSEPRAVAFAAEGLEMPNAEKSELHGVLREALTDLREELRLPVLLHVVEGMTQAEVGRVVRISPRLVNHRITKGLEILRRRLVQKGVGLSAVGLAGLLREAALGVEPAAALQSKLVA
jgi:RNA polymerase sigma factor (sigma-70 family)